MTAAEILCRQANALPPYRFPLLNAMICSVMAAALMSYTGLKLLSSSEVIINYYDTYLVY